MEQKKMFILFFLVLLYINIILLEYYKIFDMKNNNSLNIRYNLSKEFNKVYSILYDLSKSKKLKFSFNGEYKNKTYSIKKKKGIYLCVQGKNENLYVRDFVDYYKDIGFNKIIILDNNEMNGEKFEEKLKEYIDNKFIEIINIRDLESIQIPAYNYCYQKYKNEFDWIIFLDFDEFLFIKNHQRIDRYLYNNRFKKCQSILISRKIYDDNDLEKYDSRTLIKRFVRVKKNNTHCSVKTLVRGGINDLIIPNVHVSGINIQYFCNTEGERIFPKSLYGRECKNNPSVFIKHFFTKTAEEFCNKMKRGDAHYNKKNPEYKFIMMRRIKNFFFINKITKNKIKILEKCLKLDLDFFKKKIK